MMECDGILFDLDGTLWDSVDGILKTWNQVIENHNWFRSVNTSPFAAGCPNGYVRSPTPLEPLRPVPAPAA